MKARRGADDFDEFFARTIRRAIVTAARVLGEGPGAEDAAWRRWHEPTCAGRIWGASRTGKPGSCGQRSTPRSTSVARIDAGCRASGPPRSSDSDPPSIRPASTGWPSPPPCDGCPAARARPSACAIWPTCPSGDGCGNGGQRGAIKAHLHRGLSTLGGHTTPTWDASPSRRGSRRTGAAVTGRRPRPPNREPDDAVAYDLPTKGDEDNGFVSTNWFMA